MVESPTIKSKISPQQFVKESAAELKKVVWPTKNQMIKLTTIVIGVSVLAGAFLGGLDYIFTKLIGFVLK